MQGAQRLEASVPDFASAVKSPLVRLQAADLTKAMQWISCCTERELNSPALQQALLLHICEQVAADVRGPAVEALAATGAAASEGQTGLAVLISSLDSAVCELDRARSGLLSPLSEHRERTVLVRLASCLQVLVESIDCWEEELGPTGILHLTRATLIASTWLAVDRLLATSDGWQQSLSGSCLSIEEAETAARALEKAWQGVAKSKAREIVRRVPWTKWTAECSDLQKDIRTRSQTLKRSNPPPAAFSRPLEASLPRFLRSRLPSAGKPTEEGADPSKPKVSSQADTEKLPDTVSDTRWRISLSTVLGGATLVALGLGQDGFGLLPIGLPAAVKESAHTTFQQQAILVEELLARDEGSPPPAWEPIVLGGSAVSS